MTELYRPEGSQSKRSWKGRKRQGRYNSYTCASDFASQLCNAMIKPWVAQACIVSPEGQESLQTAVQAACTSAGFFMHV